MIPLIAGTILFIISAVQFLQGDWIWGLVFLLLALSFGVPAINARR